MAVSIKDLGVFKTPTLKIKDNNVWKTVSSSHVKDGGVWKQYYSATPTYSLTQSTTSIGEGNSVTFTLTTTNVPDGTSFSYSLGGTANSSDYSNYSTTGSFTVNSGQGSFTITTRADATTEGSEYFTTTVTRDGSTVATGSNVTIGDTSQAPSCWWATVGFPQLC